MLLDQDNIVPEVDSPADDSSPSIDASHVKVVYRTRGVPLLLLPPLLILAAVATLVVYQNLQPARPAVVYVRVEPEADAAAPVPSTPAVAPAPPEPIGPPESLKTARPAQAEAVVPPPVQVASKPVEPASTIPKTIFVPEPLKDFDPPMEVVAPPAASAPAPTVAAAPEPIPAYEPEKPGRRDAVGFDPSALKTNTIIDPPVDPARAVAPAVPPPDDDPAAAGGPPAPLDDIQREAQRIATERRKLAVAKRGAVARPDGAAERKQRSDRIALARREYEPKRQAFLDELKRLLKTPGDETAQAIDELCTLSGRDTSTELLDAAFGELSGPASRLSTRAKVQRLRLWGVPEPIILDHLIDADSGDVGGRKGPKGQAALVIRSARTLASIPLAKPSSPETASSATP